MVLLVPWLLAPIYYEGGGARPLAGDVAAKAGDLPGALPLVSPLLVTPTVAEIPPAEDTVDAAVEDVPEKRGVINPVACVQGLGVMQDMAALAYQTKAAGSYMGVMVAAALAREQALAGQVPNLITLRKRVKAISWGAPLRDKLVQAYELTEVPCTPAGKQKVVERPVVPRPR